MYKIITEISPSGFFGLPDNDNIVVPGPTFIMKKLIQSASSIWFKVSKYRIEDDAISANYETNEYKIEINENYIILYFNRLSLEEALNFCQEKLNIFVRILQTNYKQNFTYEFIEIYKDNVLQKFPKPGYNEDFDIIVYDLSKLKSSLDYSLSKIDINDKYALRFLEYFDRATFLYDMYSLESIKILNSRYLNFLCTEAFLNYFKSITVILGDPSIDSDYQSRFKRFGYDEIFFKNTMEFFRKIRNDNDVSHYSLKDDESIYLEIKSNLPKIKEVAIDVFEKYLNTQIYPN